MSQEEKQLLFADLSARLPYHVKVKVWLKDRTTEEGALDLEHNYANVLLDAFYYNKIKEIKPYLRPMSSITEEEKQEMHNILSPQGTAEYDYDGIHTPMNHYGDFIPYEYMCKIINYLYSKHFDVNNLIDKGLAIDCTDKNIY